MLKATQQVPITSTCNEFSTRNCASRWLISLPLEEFALTLYKGAFRVVIALR